MALFGWQFDRGMLTITLAHITFTMAYVTVVVQSRLSTFDDSLEEAALDLGARPAKVFFRITLPLIMPAILSGWLLAFTLSWDDVVVSQFVAGPGANTLPMVIYLQGAPGRESQRQRAGHPHGADRRHWAWSSVGDPDEARREAPRARDAHGRSGAVIHGRDAVGAWHWRLDVGGSSIKYALGGARQAAGCWRPLASVPTPRPAVLERADRLPGGTGGNGACRCPVGVALPSVIRSGVASHGGQPGSLADRRRCPEPRCSATARPAGGLPERCRCRRHLPRCAAARRAASRGTVMMLTFGTGIGSALFVDGRSGAQHRTGPSGGRWRGRRASRAPRACAPTNRLTGRSGAERVNHYLREHQRACSGRT